MKKFLLMAVMALISVSYASAQWKTYYALEQVGVEYPGQSFFKIDWNNKLFFLDSDSEDETKCPIKNYKENGSTKTFDVYYTQNVGGGKYCSCTFSVDDNGKITLVQTLYGGNGKTSKLTYILSDKKPAKDAISDARKADPKELIKGGLEKVANVFKKKDKEKE